MKTTIKIVLVIIVTFKVNLLFSQCEIDAGINRNICPAESISGAKLFGKVISGDFVNFSWESYYYEPALDKTYYASIMLSDTTVLQPTIEQHYERTVKYFLKGITSTGETCKDSVQLNFSDWSFLAIDKITGKSPLDTVELWIAAQSNWHHIKYEWSPNYMISDTTIEKPKVWNDKTVFYNLKITDSLGCKVSDDIFEVFVQPSSTKSFENENINIYPNPIHDHLNIDSEIEISKLEVYDLQGRLVKRSNINRINFQDEKEGTYILKIEFKNGNIINVNNG